ncbi:MAG: hypothetical protein M3272_11075, partial [Actinomycetota bacterium]|nr:hypothetical protein [Actinomycetota bacterium]
DRVWDRLSRGVLLPPLPQARADRLPEDRSLIAGLGEDPADAANAPTTIDLSHALNVKVVDEGVKPRTSSRNSRG